MGSIGQGARRRERKYKGRRGEGGNKGKEVVEEGPQELGGRKGPERMERPRTKSPDSISRASFIAREGRQDEGMGGFRNPSLTRSFLSAQKRRV